MKRILFYIILAANLTACSSDFLKEYSQDLSRVQTADDLNELLMGDCLMPLAFFSNSSSMLDFQNPNYILIHFMGDELKENIVQASDIDRVGIRDMMFPYFTWQQNCFVNKDGKSTLESEEAHYWSLAYERINNCNMVIDAANEMTCDEQGQEALRQRVLGESHYLRATYYFMLANLYGQPYSPKTAEATPCVPVKTSAYIEDLQFRRNSVAEVYRQIIEDLDRAGELLTGKPAVNIYHVSLTAVYIFRSRVHLFMQQWQEADRYARLALEQNGQLMDLRGFGTSVNTFPISASNPEVVYSNGSSCLGNMLFQYPSRRTDGYSVYAPVYSISDHLLGLFTSDDARLTSYITNRADLNARTYTYHKIINTTANFGKYKEVSDVFSIRTAEAYLNAAEAEAQLGNNEEACRHLNVLRACRITEYEDTALTGESLIQFVREERERELFLEGHRWFDLRRYSADEKYPFNATIEHTMTWYAYKGSNNLPSYTNYYRLEPGDAAYTLNIPKSVRDFQISIGQNQRPERLPYDTTTY